MATRKRKSVSNNTDKELERYEEELKYFIARRDLMNLVVRFLEIVSRFAQYKMRELLVRGLNINYHTRIEVEAEGQIGGDTNRVRLIVEAEIPEWFVKAYADGLPDLKQFIRRFIQNMQRAEANIYGFRRLSKELLQEYTETMAKRVKEFERSGTVFFIDVDTGEVEVADEEPDTGKSDK